MKNRLLAKLPKHTPEEVSYNNLYVVDYKNINKGGVVLHNETPDIPHVHLLNENEIPVCFDGFSENALPTEVAGICCSQCECIMFPAEYIEGNWILCIEMKYVDDMTNAFRKENDYPNCMISQILETVGYFRKHGIISPNSRVHAMLAFPTLIESFSESFFTGTQTKEDILIEHKILMRATNVGTIISEKRIKLSD